MSSRFVADSDQRGNNPDEWFVFDNESFSCHAGPMSESEALRMASELNQAEFEKKNQKAPVIGDTPEQMAVGLMINGKLYTPKIIADMEADLRELGSVNAGFEAGFKKGYWCGFENARMRPAQMNIQSAYDDVMRLRIENQEHARGQKC